MNCDDLIKNDYTILRQISMKSDILKACDSSRQCEIGDKVRLEQIWPASVSRDPTSEYLITITNGIRSLANYGVKT